jgi:hypothetical protein
MKEYRKYGYGRVLVEELERAAALAGREGKAEVKDGKVLIKCHSQVSPLCILPFYYQIHGRTFIEDNWADSRST